MGRPQRYLAEARSSATPRVLRLRARLVWLAPGRAYCPGYIDVGGGRIVGIGRTRRHAVPDHAILPGLINAHVHLQIPPLRRPRHRFLPWIEAVVHERARRTPGDHLSNARTALWRLLADGVTSVGEIDSTGQSPAALHSLRLSGVCYQEILGFDLRAAAARALVDRRRTCGTRDCVGGLSPHAPYSVSADLFRAARDTGSRLAIHVAETPEELEFLQTGGGPFRELLEGLGRLPAGYRAPGVGGIEFLDGLGMLGPRTLLVHAQHLFESEVERLARSRTPVVICPGTVDWFRRPRPPLSELLARRICVGLGTDSIASNDDLSIRREMGRVRRLWPGLAPDPVLAMATAAGGRCLARPGLGRLVVGGAADFVVVPMAGEAGDFLEEFTSGGLAPESTWLKGRCYPRMASLEAAGSWS